MPIVIDRSRLLFRFGLFRQVLFFFMAGSPFCTSSAYPLGAYRIPLGTGLLIPSRLTTWRVPRFSTLPPLMRWSGHNPNQDANCFSDFQRLISTPTSELSLW